jgi:hypothetical protein
MNGTNVGAVAAVTKPFMDDNAIVLAESFD